MVAMPMSGILYQTTGRGSQRIQQCRGACRAVAKLTGRHSGQRLTASIRDGNTLTEPPKSGTVLYVHVLCPYAQRAWLALLEKGVTHDVINIDLSNRPEWFNNIHGLVPVLQHNEQFHPESLDICRWVDANLDGPSLMPPDHAAADSLLASSNQFVSAGITLLSGTTARCEAFSSFQAAHSANMTFPPNLHSVARSTSEWKNWAVGRNPSQSQVSIFRRELNRISQAISASEGPYLTGDQISLADIAYWPFAERFNLLLSHFSGLDMRDLGPPQIAQWIDAMQQRTSCQMAAANPDMYLRAVKEHRTIDFFDYVTYNARDLHPHLSVARW